MTDPLRPYLIGAVLTRARRDLGLSQTAMAERLGWVQSRVSRVEMGARVAFHEVNDVAKALDMTSAALTQRVDRAGQFAVLLGHPRDAVGMQALAVYAVAMTWRKR